MRSLIAPLLAPALRFATRSYIPGPEVGDALRIAEAVAGRDWPTTICYWSDERDSPAAIAASYRATLEAMVQSNLDSELAIKVPALWGENHLLPPIVERARATGTRVVFDSHSTEDADSIFRVIDMLGPEGLGCAIPGRWRRSVADAERALALGLSVRVVKGQWADAGAPDIDLRDGFLKVIDTLAGRATRVGVATHDAPLAREAIGRLKAKGTPCELELLYALPIEPAAQAARDAGVKTRLYVPYGTAWLPYSIGKAMENPRILAWLARDMITGRRLKLPPARA